MSAILSLAIFCAAAGQGDQPSVKSTEKATAEKGTGTSCRNGPSDTAAQKESCPRSYPHGSRTGAGHPRRIAALGPTGQEGRWSPGFSRHRQFKPPKGGAPAGPSTGRPRVPGPLSGLATRHSAAQVDPQGAFGHAPIPACGGGQKAPPTGRGRPAGGRQAAAGRRFSHRRYGGEAPTV